MKTLDSENGLRTSKSSFYKKDEQKVNLKTEMEINPIFVGSKLNDFNIVEMLGKGSCGTVYKIM
jgi:hypothetical protein